MASKGLESKIYQNMKKLIESRTNEVQEQPLFAIPVVSCRNCRYCVPMYQNGTSVNTFVKYNYAYHKFHVSIQNIDNFSCNCYYGS